MKLSQIHNLLSNNYYFKTLPDYQSILAYEYAYKKIITLRDETIDLLSSNHISIYNNWIIDEKLGLQTIDSKIREMFPTLNDEDRFLIYRMSQHRISLYYPELYELNTLRQNAYRNIDFINLLKLKAKVIIPTESIINFINSIKLTVKSILQQKEIQLVNSLKASITLLSKTAKTISLNSQLKAIVKRIELIQANIILTSNLKCNLKLVSNASKELLFISQLTLSCRTISDYDEFVGIIFENKLSLNLSLEE